ncbi:DHA2 family efflux MFS transporter permease subunit [Amycolatopsis granulosa]|uniref:DHA2 family efflux MFS transporter permease subunit n=1 Tax=Amycolatopsis granulosa TaxID=185684 RepID=UPI001420D636|nr:DHA2 family efflux MFS transporter permease subunit [Amycolatopsis granulosa]NIH83440.1 EmrB/QacA subfamily drug resistance transporter [Amycolatopsis granulosa]
MSTDQPAGRSRWLALAVLSAQTLMIVLDQTIVNVALPAIRDDLGFTQSNLSWVVNAYLIPFGGLLLLAGRLGDLAGRRRVFLTGMAVFTLASLLAGLAWNPETLMAARFLQGAGGAASTAVALGMVVRLFPEPAARAKALGTFSFVQAAGGSIGSMTGGLLTQALSWHWIFLINLPIGVAAGLLAPRVLEADRGLGLGAGADWLGAVLVTAALMLGVYTIVGVDSHGWTSAHTLVLGAVSLVLLVAFLLRQGRARDPLLPLRIFTSRGLSGANLTMALLVSSMFGFQFLVVLYLRQVLGLSAQATGLAMVPIAVMIAVVSLAVSPRVATRFGDFRVLLTGLVLIGGGLAWLARVPADGGFAADVLGPTLAMGAGFGLAMPALMGLGMRDARPEDTGLASGLFNTTQQVAGALGLSVLAVLAATRTQSVTGVRPEQALTAGYHLAFWVGTGLVAAAFVVAALVLRPGVAARRTGEPGANVPDRALPQL